MGVTGNTQNGQLLIDGGRIVNSPAYDGTISTTIDGAPIHKGYSYLGLIAGSTGTATITGNGSALNSTILNVGFHGNGILGILSGGRVNSVNSSIGTHIGSSSSVTVHWKWFRVK